MIEIYRDITNGRSHRKKALFQLPGPKYNSCWYICRDYYIPLTRSQSASLTW